MIAVGIVKGRTTCWFSAHAIGRSAKASVLCVFGTDDARTAYHLPIKHFAGVAPSVIDYNGRQYPDISEWDETQ